MQSDPLHECAQAALAGAASWQEYGKLFLESRFVHVTSTDFAALSLFAPFWMWNDAEKRGWESRCVHDSAPCIRLLMAWQWLSKH